MRRRQFLGIVGGAAAWPIAARGQQRTPVPIIGFLRTTSAADAGHMAAAFRQGLRESGYAPDSFVVEARFAEGHPDRLPKLVGELVALKVAAIVDNTPAARAAKAASSTIPIVFVTGTDPTAEKLVTSINRPGGNITGVSFFDVPITGKRLSLLRELVPKAEIIATLQDSNYYDAQTGTREIETTAKAIGVKIVALKVSRAEDIDAAFPTALRSGAAAAARGHRPLHQQSAQPVGRPCSFSCNPDQLF